MWRKYCLLIFFLGVKYDHFVCLAIRRSLEMISSLYHTFSGSVDDGSSEATCPSDLLNTFSSVTISQYNDASSCANNVMDGCSSKTKMSFTYDPSCTAVHKFSGKSMIFNAKKKFRKRVNEQNNSQMFKDVVKTCFSNNIFFQRAAIGLA